MKSFLLTAVVLFAAQTQANVILKGPCAQQAVQAAVATLSPLQQNACSQNGIVAKPQDSAPSNYFVNIPFSDFNGQNFFEFNVTVDTTTCQILTITQSH